LFPNSTVGKQRKALLRAILGISTPNENTSERFYALNPQTFFTDRHLKMPHIPGAQAYYFLYLNKY
jgi:hypothetical protein